MTRTFRIVKLPLHVLKMLSEISRVSYTRKCFYRQLKSLSILDYLIPMKHEKTHLISAGDTDARFHDFRYDFIA